MNRFQLYVGSAMALVLLAGCSGDWPGLQLSDTSAAARPAPAAAADPYQRGKSQFAEGNYGLALQSFQAAISARGDSIETLNAIAATYDQLGRYDVAAGYYRRALEIDPKSVQTLNNLGYSMVLQRRYDEAIHYFKLARADQANPAVMPGANIKLVQDLMAREGRATALAEPSSGVPAAAPTAPVAVAPVNPVAGNAAPTFVLAEKPVAASAAPLPAAVAAPAAGTAKGVWIERTARGVHTLVTRPEPQQLMSIAQQPVDPRVAHVAGNLVSSDLAVQAQTALALPPVAAPAPQPVVLALAVPTVEPPVRRDAAPVGPSLGGVVDVSNGAGRLGMAARFRGYLESRGLANMRLSNDVTFTNRTTVVFFKDGYLAAAETVARELPVAVQIRRDDEQKAGVRVRLGGDLLDFDRRQLMHRVAANRQNRAS